MSRRGRAIAFLLLALAAAGAAAAIMPMASPGAASEPGGMKRSGTRRTVSASPTRAASSLAPAGTADSTTTTARRGP